MFVKRSLLAGCVVVAAVSPLRAQALRPASGAANLFDDGSVAPASLRPTRNLLAAPAGAPAAWLLDRPKPPAAVAHLAPGPEAVDDGALRYYAAQNDLARVSAEIRRIRTKHPEWEPPEDLFSATGSTEDEKPLWDLFAKQDYPGLKAKIAELQQDKPDWQPSRDLLTKLRLGEARDGLVRASDAKQWGTVVDLAAADGALLTCANVDVVWRTAEALIRLGDETRGNEAYRYVLTTCDDGAMRLATVQKASLILTRPGALDALVQLGRRQADGRGEFDDVVLDGVRQRVGAASEAKRDVSAQDIAALTEAFARGRDDRDAQLLGWSSYARKLLPEAERWFRAALDVKPSPKSAEGLVLALRDQGKTAEAEALALRYKDADPLNRKQVVELTSADLLAGRPVATELMAAFTDAVDSTRSADGAQAYAWSLYRSGQTQLADAWFRKSVDWQPNEGAVIGLVVTSNKLKHRGDAATLIAKYHGNYPKLAELEAVMRPQPIVRHMVQGRRKVTVARTLPVPHDGHWDASADAIVTMYRSGRYDQAMAMLNTRLRTSVEPHGLSVIRGWTQYHSGDWNGAQTTFGGLKDTQVAREAQDGLRVLDEGFRPKLYH